MSRKDDNGEYNLPRRTFMKATGATTAGSVFGLGAVDSVLAAEDVDERYYNWRTVEASKVWMRGYRGRPDRSLALTDSGVESRHPDLGPWNGVDIKPNDDGYVLQSINTNDTPTTVNEISASGTLGPGSADAGQTSEASTEFKPSGGDLVIATLSWDEGESAQDIDFRLEDAEGNEIARSETFQGPEKIRAVLPPDAATPFRLVAYTYLSGPTTYEISGQVIDADIAFGDVSDPLAGLTDDTAIRLGTVGASGNEPESQRIERKVESGEVYQSATVIESPEELPPGNTVSVVGEIRVERPQARDNIVYAAVGTPDGDIYGLDRMPGFGSGTVEVSARIPESAAGETVVWTFLPVVSESQARSSYKRLARNGRLQSGVSTVKTVGWYGGEEQPLDGNGHGTHVASIMAGSGRGSVVDEAATQVDESGAILAAGDTLSYEVAADAGTGVFGSAFGENIEVVIEGPGGEQLDRSDFQEGDNTEIDDRSAFGTHVVAEAATVHDTGTASYIVYIRPHSGELASPGRVTSAAAGPFTDPDDTDGDRTGSGIAGFHSGMAPNASLVGFQGLSDATGFLATNAGGLTSDFNLRAVNMSWGIVGGAPLGAAGSNLPLSGNTASHILDIAKAGVLTVAAAGNSTTPANSSIPAIADEAISVVATDELDGIVDYSSGGSVAVDEDGEGVYAKPDVTAPGGGSTDLINAAQAGDPDQPENGQPPIRDYVEKAGTSMASPYACGAAGLVANAMEADAPDPITLPAPDDAGFEDVMRLKQVILATATETAFTAAPYHKAHVPTYDQGGRDPYEGFGRINPDAAVDAVSNDLFDPSSPAIAVDSPATATPLETDDDAEDGPASVSTTLSGEVGLNVPFDNRALAGYVEAKGGALDISVEVDALTGGSAGLAKGDTHVDLFVYDAEEPAANGEPNVVESAMGMDGTASVSVDLESREFEGDDLNRETFYVVAKLVNIPGVVTGYDVQANLTMDLSFEAADVPVEPPENVNLNASGSRSDDGSVFTGGQTNRVQVTVETFNDELADEVRIIDQVPEDWTVAEGFGDVESTADGGTTIDLGTVSAEELGTDAATRVYFVEAPEETADTGSYTFGPAKAEAVEPATFGDDADREQGSTREELGGTDTNYVVAISTEV